MVGGRELNSRVAGAAWLPRAGVALWLALIAGSCAVPTQTHVSDQTEAVHSIAAGEAVVLFPAQREPGATRGNPFFQCLDAEFARQISASLRVMDAGYFQDAMFPWFEAEQLPATARELDALITRPHVKDRIAALNVRYLVTIASVTDSDGFPGILCGGGPHGAGCFGVMTEERSTQMSAVIWDIVEGERAGEVSATSSGDSFGLAFVLPLLFLAYTEHDACKALATELSATLTGHRP
jgi:hypothetical protein